MYITFEKLPEEARVWVYQAERALSDSEQDVVLETGKQFIDQWVTHGQPLIASIQVRANYFVIIAVDDTQLPSGCSIDASVDFMRNLTNNLSLDFFDRTNIPLQIEGKVKLVPLVDLKNQIRNGAVSEETLVYNTLVNKKSELNNWLLSLRESWLARYFPQTQEK
ncbi:MAG: hypothetical protein DHS20C17_08210 [Cyclobacteriaceae bacterium]|nr:MAG: hypothetical protein DHS20C17_08210 [Cyclobacteriaceae bacterium]